MAQQCGVMWRTCLLMNETVLLAHLTLNCWSWEGHLSTVLCDNVIPFFSSASDSSNVLSFPEDSFLPFPRELKHRSHQTSLVNCRWSSLPFCWVTQNCPRPRTETMQNPRATLSGVSLGLEHFVPSICFFPTPSFFIGYSKPLSLRLSFHSLWCLFELSISAHEGCTHKNQLPLCFSLISFLPKF